MCRPVKCDVCAKTTWAGCGQHVSQVKATVPSSQWCNGQHSQREIDTARAANPGFLTRLFRR
ncbi:MAG: hypothetical protein L0K41_01430 [Yaniella sp.]|nr:hypothetical protein [Yaniella sp.]MDN5731266.1 hypothetical protein [Yaniella sp.]MDN5816118.1 hypothetical protein [Yaniella sp.]MDN5818536.1 hypothetical protein [Yaniella sp.]MDN5838157.1 hypothetical protein [Yaniella sp.]MDN5889582.1 hypothetical protein [Yaniella sp.]